MGARSKNPFRSLKGLPQGVWAVSISMMLIAVSTAMIFSVSPFFVTEVLGISLLSMGIMEGIAEGLSYLFKLGSGYSGDFFKRKKPPLMVGVLLATVSKPLFIFANGAGMVIASKVIERISNGIMATPRDAYCAEEGPPTKRGASLGLMMSLKTLGCTIGSLTIGGLMLWTENYRLLLWIGFIPCALSVFVLWKYMHERRTEQQEGILPKKRQRLKWEDFKGLRRNYWTLVIVSALFMCARFSDGFIILRMFELGAPKWLCTSTIGIFNLISALFCLPIGSLSDRIDRSRMLYFSFITLALSNICFIFNGGLLLSLVGVIFWGAQRGTSQMLFAAIIADEVPEKIIGTALGIYYLVSGIVSVVAGAVAGKAATVSLHYAFIFGLIVSGIALVGLFIRNEILSGPHKKDVSGPIVPA